MFMTQGTIFHHFRFHWLIFQTFPSMRIVGTWGFIVTMLVVNISTFCIHTWLAWCWEYKHAIYAVDYIIYVKCKLLAQVGLAYNTLYYKCIVSSHKWFTRINSHWAYQHIFTSYPTWLKLLLKQTEKLGHDISVTTKNKHDIIKARNKTCIEWKYIFLLLFATEKNRSPELRASASLKTRALGSASLRPCVHLRSFRKHNYT